MPTDVFHMDANGVRISVDRAVFAEHVYATRNISSVVTVTDAGVRWPGKIMLALGLALIVAGLVISHTITLMFGAVAVLSGSLNLARKRPKYGVRIVTRRGPVYVLASQDKPYAETVSAALRRAVEAARERRGPASREEPDDLPDAPGDASPHSSEQSSPAGPVRAQSRPRAGGQPARFRRRRRR